MSLLYNLFGRFPDIQGKVIVWKKKAGYRVYNPNDMEQLHSDYGVEISDVYYQVQTHDPTMLDGRGSKASSKQVTCFWSDIDLAIKDAIKYPTIKEVGILFTKLDESGFAPSCIINSGRGIHAYWYLDKPYDTHEYMGVVKKWNHLLVNSIKTIVKHNLSSEALPDDKPRVIEFDQVGDMARILRVPGTLNSKSGTLVREVGGSNKVFTMLELSDKCGYNKSEDHDVKGNKKKSSSKMLENMGMMSTQSLPTLENMIAQCGQLQHFAEVEGQVTEPIWYRMAGLFQYMEDGDTQFINISALADPYMDSDRSEGGALAKMDQWKEATDGPTNCNAFDETNPGICNECTHFGSITTPLQLGHSIAVEVTTSESLETQIDEISVTVVKESEEYVFVPPQPFFFDLKGRLSATIDKKDVVLCDSRVIPVERVMDANGGSRETMFYVLKKDEDVSTVSREPFAIEQSEYTTKVGIGILNSNNALIQPSSQALMMNYLTKATLVMDKQVKAKIAHTKIGWVEDENKFLLGERAFTGEGRADEDKLSEALKSIIGDISFKGSLDEWKKAISILGREGMDAHMLTFFGAFAAPLFISTDHAGIMVNLLSRDSGTFKSFALKMLTSVYGKPDFNLITSRDTENAMMSKLSARCDLPSTYDEITNIDPGDLSDLVYAITQGKDKDRMNTNAEMRVNIGRWRTVLFSSSNASLDDKLGSINTAERMRLLEMSVQGVNINPPMTPFEASEMMHIVDRNYGKAGMMWIDHIVSNRDEVFAECKDMIRYVSEQVGQANDKRFWITYVALSMVSAAITYRLGLHSFDLKKLMAFSFKVLENSHERIVGDHVKVYDMVYEFMTEHVMDTTIVKKRENDEGVGEVESLARSNLKVYQLKLTGAPNTSIRTICYISRTHMKIYLASRRENLTDLISQLKELGVLIDNNEGEPFDNSVIRVPTSSSQGGKLGLRSFGIDLDKYHEIYNKLRRN